MTLAQSLAALSNWLAPYGWHAGHQMTVVHNDMSIGGFDVTAQFVPPLPPKHLPSQHAEQGSDVLAEGRGEGFGGEVHSRIDKTEVDCNHA